MLASFFFAFIQRVISGYASYYGYKKDWDGLIYISIAMLLLPALLISLTTTNYNWLFWLFTIVNTVTVGMKALSFNRSGSGLLAKYRDIHLWENLVTGGFMVFLALIGHNLLMLVFSVYPALILHKGFINLGNKLPFFSEKTDDSTGKTYGIPLLGIKVKRSSLKTRLVLAGLSILAVVIYTII